jgi:ATP-binding protein involved in chromosome partitioning
MPVEAAAVRAALRNVREPSLDRDVVELGMVRAIVPGRRGRVALTLALPVEEWFERDELRRRVEHAVGAIEGVDDVRVELDVMSDDEVEAMGAVLDAVPHFTEQGSETRVLGISSGKGGVGKSSVTVNVAVALARRGRSVGILDADIYGFSVPRMLGVTEAPIAVLPNVLVPPTAHRVRCMSMDFLAPEDRAIMWRGPMLHKALEEFITKVYWGEPDYLLFDMPPGTGDVALSMAQHLPRSELFVVTTPQAAAQRVARRTALMSRDPNVKLEVVGVIENMSWFTGDDGKRYQIFGSGGGQMLADDVGVPLLAQIPLVPALREGGDIGLPITVADPGSEAAAAFDTIADWIERHPPKRVHKRELRLV